MGFLDSAIEFLRSVWNFIKHLVIRVLNFASNIVAWFKDPFRLQKLKQNKQKIAVSIKDNLSNGKFNVVNCLYDTQTEEVEAYEEQNAAIESQEIDSETQKQFGDKPMIVLK